MCFLGKRKPDSNYKKSKGMRAQEIVWKEKEKRVDFGSDEEKNVYYYNNNTHIGSDSQPKICTTFNTYIEKAIFGFEICFSKFLLCIDIRVKTEKSLNQMVVWF